MLAIFSFLIVITTLVFIHELGHYLAARSVGVRVEKFYIGFNLFGLGIKKTINNTEYGIGLFPLGGYVKVAGIIDESMDANHQYKDDEFQSKNTIQKIWIMSAGVIMNFILAIFIFAHLTYYYGINEPDPRAIVGSICEGCPSEIIGLQENDLIISINGNIINDWSDLTKNIHNKPNQIIYIEWIRDGITFSDSLKTISNPQLIDDEIIDVGMIGISPIIHNKKSTIFQAFYYGSNQTISLLKFTWNSLLGLLKGNISIKEMAGPIMIAKIAGETASSGAYALLSLMAMLSINLGLINILPVPGLDGGHVMIALIEGILNRDLSLKTKLNIQKIGIILLMTLMLTIMINDVLRLIN